MISRNDRLNLSRVGNCTAFEPRKDAGRRTKASYRIGEKTPAENAEK